jgi:two-component system cell cycle sensor histidine kinase/response regulator CckA
MGAEGLPGAPGMDRALTSFVTADEASLESESNRAGFARLPAQLPDIDRQAASLHGGETILVIDDEGPMQRAVKRILTASGYQVILAQDGKEALAALGEHEGPIHLILSDLNIGIESGLELVQRLISKRTDVKVLFMSGHSSDSIRKSGSLDPNMNFIQKPFLNEALARKVREVLDA